MMGANCSPMSRFSRLWASCIRVEGSGEGRGGEGRGGEGRGGEGRGGEGRGGERKGGEGRGEESRGKGRVRCKNESKINFGSPMSLHSKYIALNFR